MKNPGMDFSGQKPSWWVYVIECESGAWYTGVTNDLERRFTQHASGKGAKYFRMDKPKRIAAAKPCESKSEALQSEAALKALERSAKGEWIRANAWGA